MPKPSKILSLPTVTPKKPDAARRSRRKDGLYQVECRYTDESGATKRKSFYGKTQAEAARKCKAFQDEIASGLRVDKADTTVQQWGETWLKVYKSGITPNALRAVKYDLKLLNDVCGHKTLRAVVPSDVKLVYNKRAGQSASSIKKTKANLHSLFEAARIDRIIPVNPCEGVSPPEGTEGTHRPLEAWEQDLIEKHYAEHRFGRCVMLMLYAGHRRGEALAFDVDRDTDFDKDTVRVTKAVRFEGNHSLLVDPKTEAGVREAPLLPQLRAALQNRHGLIAPSKGGKLMTSSAFKRAWESFLYFLSVKHNGCHRRWAKDKDKWIEVDFRCHDLRHTYCTMLYEAGVDEKTAQEWMGHDDEEMTKQVYSHLRDAQREKSRTALLEHVRFTENITGKSSPGKTAGKSKVYRLKPVEK